MNVSDKAVKLVIAGNPNVGKSTVFNELTGMKQHTGNWAGKTVDLAAGSYEHNGRKYEIVDVPGTYSLMSHSREEEVARDYICFGGCDCVIVVCDATCLERNLNLVLQVLEITGRAVVAVNLIDEAKKHGVRIDFEELEKELGVPVVPMAARSGIGFEELKNAVERVIEVPPQNPLKISCISAIEEEIGIISDLITPKVSRCLNSRWVASKLLEGNQRLIASISDCCDCDLSEWSLLNSALESARNRLAEKGIDENRYVDNLVSSIVITAEGICADCVFLDEKGYNKRDRRIDRWLTDKRTGIPIMIVFLMVIFWITISGANYPSQLLSDFFAWGGERLRALMEGAPDWLTGCLLDGVYRVLTWVVSVMLPPMAIFFPLFTLLEDLGYLPRVAFNLDKFFKKANTCGKQALSMCMSFGCNACGITGTRIIDSPRERLIAIITNNFIPCNGRFPMLISLATIFFAGAAMGFAQTAISTLIITAVIILGVVTTFFISGLLSKTILKGIPSSFTLELPPYRRPQFLKVLARSVLDRTLFVLGRAVVVAAPAGLVIWLMANITVDGASLLQYCSDFLDPFARLMGLDGVILLAFILGFPANEIVIPIVIMCYMSSGTLVEFDSIWELKELLAANGWTWVTAVSTMLFSLMHFPCSTTCMTIYKETKSLKWTLVSFLVPTVTGIIACMIFSLVANLFV